MQRIRGAASIPEKYNLAAAAQRGRRFFRELRDSAYQFTGKTLFDASALFKLTANLFGRRSHRFLAQNDFFALAHDAARGVARIDYQFCGLGYRPLVIARVDSIDNYGLI